MAAPRGRGKYYDKKIYPPPTALLRDISPVQGQKNERISKRRKEKKKEEKKGKRG